MDEFNYGRSDAILVVKSDGDGGEVKREGTVLADRVARQAATYIVEHKPNLCFIHFADADSAGHRSGWGSPQQLETFAKSDAALDVVLEAISQAGIADQSVVIVTADHGGHGHTHGSKNPEDMEIPWVA